MLRHSPVDLLLPKRERRQPSMFVPNLIHFPPMPMQHFLLRMYDYVLQAIDEEQLEEIKEAFSLFDTDGNGNFLLFC